MEESVGRAALAGLGGGLGEDLSGNTESRRKQDAVSHLKNLCQR